MTDDYMLVNVLEKIQEMKRIEINDESNILVGTDGKLPDDISLKNIMASMASVIKDIKDFYPQLFLEEALYDE